jgi:hypothetical protein
MKIDALVLPRASFGTRNKHGTLGEHRRFAYPEISNRLVAHLLSLNVSKVRKMAALVIDLLDATAEFFGYLADPRHSAYRSAS